jgi:alkanesulfonate monooxygenase SsuD/methylene tetrahydromethanopterin reductase-like flavin-dependent oxidoreductase (luciferase family)
MHFGGLMFITDYAMDPAALAKALEVRGVDSIWVPEHSHIPASRRSPYPGGDELPKP